MGYLSALDFAGNAPLETALSWHLTANHYPPLPEALVDPCKRAIELARAGEWDAEISIEGAGVKLRVRPYSGETTDRPTVARLVEVCHLEAFLDAASEEG